MTSDTAEREAKYRTGDAANWAPDGFAVHIDTSWDGSGCSIACRRADVRGHRAGSPERLGAIFIRNGAPILQGADVFRLRHKDQGRDDLGLSYLPRLTLEEAEHVFAEHEATVGTVAWAGF